MSNAKFDAHGCGQSDCNYFDIQLFNKKVNSRSYNKVLSVICIDIDRFNANFIYLLALLQSMKILFSLTVICQTWLTELTDADYDITGSCHMMHMMTLVRAVLK